MKLYYYRILLLIYIVFFVYSGENMKNFATWEMFEADKLASIWLIKRFIDSKAEIIIYPKDTDIKDEIAFDTPNSRFKRTFNKCTFELLIQHYKIKDKKINSLAMIIHDIEINKWEHKIFTLTSMVDSKIIEIISDTKDAKTTMDNACVFFDELYESLPEKLEKVIIK